VAHPGAVLTALLLLAAFAGAIGGWILRKRAKQQESLHQGMKRLEPYLLSWVGFVKAAAGLGILAAFWAGLFSLPSWAPPVLAALLQASCLLAKALFFCWLFVWVRWTLPRFRYDQLMDLGWKVMLPVALLNLLVTGLVLLSTK
jgi:NADH-quinone oxidoreductase subunit H